MHNDFAYALGLLFKEKGENDKVIFGWLNFYTWEVGNVSLRQKAQVKQHTGLPCGIFSESWAVALATHTREYYSFIIKNEILPFVATWGPRRYYAKCHNSDRKRQLHDFTCMFNKWINDHQNKKIRLTGNKKVVARGEEAGGKTNRWGRLEGTSFQLQNKCHGYVMYSLRNIVNSSVISLVIYPNYSGEHFQMYRKNHGVM